MATTTNTTLNHYKVMYAAREHNPLSKDVAAAYFQTEGQFTVFKDENGKAVYAINNANLIEVSREAQ
ncbi:hypothetical protein [Streptomyces sp. NPDC088812]|uniref:hypothetical protein n=1 Tax=Streptomyces sp. NPDC088812 TaxID=3365905 RepID=UPI0038068E68